MTDLCVLCGKPILSLPPPPAAWEDFGFDVLDEAGLKPAHGRCIDGERKQLLLVAA